MLTTLSISFGSIIELNADSYMRKDNMGLLGTVIPTVEARLLSPAHRANKGTSEVMIDESMAHGHTSLALVPAVFSVSLR